MKLPAIPVTDTGPGTAVTEEVCGSHAQWKEVPDFSVCLTLTVRG